MILDLAVFSILATTIFCSMRKGFPLSLVSFFKGFVSLAIAWLFCDDFAKYLLTETQVGIIFNKKTSLFLSAKWEDSPLYSSLPEIIRGDAGSAAIGIGANRLTLLLLTIISFFLIIAGLRIVLALAGRLFSHKYNSGFAGCMDFILGIILGSIWGILHVFIFLALLIPVAGVMFPEYCETVVNWLNTSIIAGDLYNNNILLKLLHDFLA